MHSRKSSTKENQNVVRKSILRNPEIPLTNDQNKNKRITINELINSKECDLKDLPSTTKSLHEPTINKLTEWRKTLYDIKNYQAKEISSMNDISKNTQDFINRAVSSKLNFPSNQPVFKNLPKIEEDSNPKTSIPLQKVLKSIKLKNPNSREEMQKILDELVESEYKHEEMKKRKNYSQAHTDEWLGLGKFKEPVFKQQNHKTETQIYHEQLRKDLFNNLFSSEDYLSSRVKFDPTLTELQIKGKRKKECNCFSDFYAQHSMCS